MEKESEIRLRRRIEELVRSRVGLLERDISNLQREVNESFTRLLERTDAAGSMEDADDSLAQIAAEVVAQIDQAGAESVRLGADLALLRDSVAELDEQRSQADVLNTLVSRASNFAPRIVLFVIKGTNALAWAARGLDDPKGGQVRGLSVPLQAHTVLRTALNSQQTFYGSPEDQAENQSVYSRFGTVEPQRMLAVPLKVRGKSAAIVYADSAERGKNAINVEAIELLVQTAGLVVELVSLRSRMAEAVRAARQHAAAPAPSAAPAPTAEPPAADEAASAEPAPAPEAEPAEAQPEARPPEESTTDYSADVSDQASAPVEAESYTPAYSAPAEPESYTPVYSAPAEATAEPESASSFAEPEVVEQPPAAFRTGPLEDEEKLHNDARRFARLLVSEIKLYNEQKVADGRRNNDLYGRLKDDIERSRQMYEKRVTPTVAAKSDYFYEELVNTLAEGDVGKLGSDYPGPSASLAG